MGDERISYEEWTCLIGSFFFDSAHDGSEILFGVDDHTLAEISGLSEPEAVASLAEAVRGVITKYWDVRQVRFRIRRWRTAGSNGDHPALPFLALTVLAASKMQADENVAASNFYVRLRTALDPGDANQGVPGSYLDDVRELWDSLAEWANVHLRGERGRLVLRDPGPQYGRGAAVQHALVRSHDLSQLDKFFRRIGLQPGEDVVGKELLRALRVWTESRGEAWARRLNRLCSSEELSSYAAALLEREASRWDGLPRDRRTGRGVGQIRLGIARIRRPELGLFLRADPRLPRELALALPGVGATEVTQSGDWFEPHCLNYPDVGSVLAEGLRVPAGKWRFEFRPEDAYPLTYDDELGMWVSVDSISFGDRYHLLVRQNHVSEVKGWMAQVSAVPPREDEVANQRLPKGWSLLMDLQLERRPSKSPPACVAGAIPTGSGPRLRLVGGLPLTVGHSVFLRGGEPGLALSSLVNHPKITITEQYTGRSETLTVGIERDEEVPLWKLQLLPGVYRVDHGDTSTTFTIVDGIAEVSGPGAGSIQSTEGALQQVVGTSPVPQLTQKLPPTVRAPYPGLRVFVLGANFTQIEEIDTPVWISTLVGQSLSWNLIDYWGNFDPVWQITKRSAEAFCAISIIRTEPHGECDPTSNWARMIKIASLEGEANDADRQLWEKYRREAGAKS